MNPARRLMLKCLPAGLVALFVSRTKAEDVRPESNTLGTKSSPHLQAIYAQRDERHRILNQMADKILAFMPITNYAGRYVFSMTDHLFINDRVAELPQHRFVMPPIGKLPGEWPGIDLSELVDLMDRDMKSLQEIIKIMVHRHKVGKPVTTDLIEPGANMPVRYQTQRYVKDIDELRADHRKLAYVLGQVVADLLAVPHIETADWLDLDAYIRQEAFLLEIVGWTTQLQPAAVESFPFSVEPFHTQFRQQAGFDAAIAAFEAKHGRKPHTLVMTDVEVKELCKWLPLDGLLKCHAAAASWQYGVRQVVADELGIKLELFHYCVGKDNNPRLLG